ncbi:NAD(P)H-binding protein [Natronorubrum bangense]|uniref:NAD-dependent epimerase/dehydratase n=2 Tax=Natronorubrum bangense TaxID=61858 RepID=L9WHQ9_9EURY|nr:NAD(P)H-binding protein [Natronorubrum bangense]ELY48781.1 NAD-dependent epimerase/dehydratase [Natronorubrum bangense JCM 10635]QCC54015.1 NAD-dependent epimerase/dehydratase family protein [Natronorubrum bangense]
MNVLVTGATGFVGRQLVDAMLTETDHDVTVLVRDATAYEPPGDVTVVEGNVLEPGGFEASLEQIDVAYYLIHAMDARGDFAERDRRGARNFALAANAAGVERIIYLSGLGSDADKLSSHLASRREVESILATGDAEVTVLRAAVIIGDGSASFRMIRQLATRLPVMVTPQWIRTPCQPIAIDDVVAYCLAVLERPETAGETYEIGGPDRLTYREMLLKTAEIITGRRPLIIPVPILSPRLSAYWVGLVTDVPKELAYPLIGGVRNPVIVTDDRLAQLVDVEPTPFEVAVRRAVSTEVGTDERLEAVTRPGRDAE